LLTAHLERTGLLDVRVKFLPDHSINSIFPLISWTIPKLARISIVIPSRDNAPLLSRCLDSLISLTDYTNYQVIIVDTGSVNSETFALYEKYERDVGCKVVRFEEKFNFSRACNLGAQAADGEFLLFLNNDTEILQADWLHLMVQWFERPGVGIVGPKLLFPDGTLQHAGVIIGIGGLADHLFAGEAEQTWSVFGSDCWYRNLLGVTGACLLITRRLFDKLHGFDEEFRLNFSDIDLCLRAKTVGYRTVYTPHVRLIHHESATHRGHVPRVDFERASLKWRCQLLVGDPDYNANLSYTTSFPEIRRGLSDTPGALNAAMLKRLPNKAILDIPSDFR
jgi:GT2 family glycosyltransferase